MQPCFQVAVKIATVVAARPRGGSDAGSLASTAAWAGLVWAPWPARVPQLRYPGERPACGQRGGRGMVPAGWQLSGVVVQIGGGSVIFGPFDWSACLPCCLGTCPGGAPWHARGSGLWKGHCTTQWLFCWLLRGTTIFEKARLPVGAAGFEPATP